MVPAELTRIGEWGSSIALSAYSAVMLRKMLPVHTNRIDGIVFTNLAEHKINDKRRVSQAIAATGGNVRLDNLSV